MKKSNFLFGAVAALAMGGALTACSDDMPENGIDNGKVEFDQTRYLNVSICNPKQGTPGDSRAAATDFETGTAVENYVHELYFVFYDANGDAINHYQLTFDNNTNTNNGGGGTFNPEGDAQLDGSVGKIWTSTIPVEMTAGMNMPSYVMAFVNPITSSEILKSSLSQVEALQREQVRLPDNHFPMSNSVYYGNNPITGENNIRMVATPVTTAQLAATEAEAEALPAVEIYVERYAAKVNLTLKPDAIADDIDAASGNAVNGYSLKFVPEYWRPNAIDKKTWVVKHFGLNKDGVIDFKPTYADMNGRFAWEWNDAANFRSYWACSPSYYANKYPKVSDDIQDGGTYDLHYFSFNEIKNSQINGQATSSSIAYDAANGFNTPFYARETTASSASWQNAEEYNPVATISSAVIVGRYELSKDGVAMPKNTTFYLYGKTDGKWNLYDTDAKIVAAMAANQYIVLDATTKAPVTAEQAADIFEVKHPEQAVRDEKGTVVAGRFVALQMKAGKTGFVYYDANAEGDKYVTITDANLNKVNSDLLTAGYARRYGEGLAYFNIPVQHLGFNQTGELDYTTARAGSFGLVRNHVYTISISSIKGLATALRDADQPIVPPMDEQTYYISAKLNVLNWRLVPVQNVEL